MYYTRLCFDIKKKPTCSVKKIRNKLNFFADNNIIKKKYGKGDCYVKEIQCRKFQRL